MKLEEISAALYSGDIERLAPHFHPQPEKTARRIAAAKKTGISPFFRTYQESTGWYWNNGEVEEGPFPTVDDAYLDAYYALNLQLVEG